MKQLVKSVRKIVEAKVRGSEIPPAHLEHMARTEGWLPLEGDLAKAEELFAPAHQRGSFCRSLRQTTRQRKPLRFAFRRAATQAVRIDGALATFTA